MKILLVDGHPVVRRGVKATLADAHPTADFVEAGTSREAYPLLPLHPWGLVVLDLQIPGRNGLELIRDIHSLRAGTPILVLTGLPDREHAVRALAYGASGYLIKGSPIEEILHAADEVMAGRVYLSPVLAYDLIGAIRRNRTTDPHEVLSNREPQVLLRVAEGKSTKEIATEMSVSVKTIETYRARIAQKTGLASGIAITRYALQRQLVD